MLKAINADNHGDLAPSYGVISYTLWPATIL
jgi:hypothetical protein